MDIEMKEHFIQRYEVLSTFPVTTPACAIYPETDGDGMEHLQVMTWALVRERTYRQNGAEVISALMSPPQIEGIVRVGLYGNDEGKMVWTVGLACEMPNLQGYVDGVEP